MIEKDHFQALAKVTENEYDERAENGARILFDVGVWRMVDTVKNDYVSFFIIDFGLMGETQYYLLDLETAYQLLTLYHYGSREYLMDKLFEICQ